MTDLDKRLSNIQPKLKLVDPKSFYISWTFAGLNFCLGIYFINEQITLRQDFLTGAGITHTMWGAMFLLLGGLISLSLVRNNWKWIRRIMMAAFFVKLFWAVILFFVGMDEGFMKILASFAMWFSLASIQAVVMIYFIPKDVESLLAEYRSYAKGHSN